MADYECKHCEESIFPAMCEECGKIIKDQCRTCHREVSHGIIKIQNINMVGNAAPGMSPDEDPDAFGRADDD